MWCLQDEGFNFHETMNGFSLQKRLSGLHRLGQVGTNAFATNPWPLLKSFDCMFRSGFFCSAHLSFNCGQDMNQ